MSEWSKLSVVILESFFVVVCSNSREFSFFVVVCSNTREFAVSVFWRTVWFDRNCVVIQCGEPTREIVL